MPLTVFASSIVKTGICLYGGFGGRINPFTYFLFVQFKGSVYL